MGRSSRVKVEGRISPANSSPEEMALWKNVARKISIMAPGMECSATFQGGTMRKRVGEICLLVEDHMGNEIVVPAEKFFNAFKLR